MSRTKQDKPYWAESFTLKGVRVYAWERADRGGKVFVKYVSADARGQDRRSKLKLPGDLVVRDEKGRLDKRRIRLVQDAVQELAAQLVLGQPPTKEEPAQKPLSIADGFSAVLDLKTGKFPTRTRRWDELRRAFRKLERILGPQRAWIDLLPADTRRAWRTFAEAARTNANDGEIRGARQAEVTIDALFSAANWLREEDLIAPTAAQAPMHWRKRLKDDWQRITGEEVTVSRPRHSDDQMRQLFAHTDSPDVDPRFAFAFAMGGEQRVGQVLRCWRTDLDLPPVNHDAMSLNDSGSLGRLTVRGVGKKKASPIALTPAQRIAAERVIAGYLSDYEKAWLAGEISDYPLFPAGRFKKGKAKVVAAPKFLSRDAALGMFHELERIAKVPSLPGRGWYGVRRVATDMGEDVEKDERVLNSITGHTDSATRRDVYQERERPSVLRQAAITRDKIRRGVAPLVESAEQAKKGA